MFGMGFLEIFLILVVAVIALGPEKLPNAAVDIAKMIRKLKASVDDAKSSIDSELNLSGMKSEAEKFKDSMGVDRLTSLNLDTIINEDDDFLNNKKEDKKAKKENKKNKKIKSSYIEAPKKESISKTQNLDSKEEKKV